MKKEQFQGRNHEPGGNAEHVFDDAMNLVGSRRC